MTDSSAYRLRVRQLAERQQGHVARRQVLDLGIHSRWIDAQLRSGWLIAVHAGVYAVGRVGDDGHGQARAALLACGDSAALSHASATVLYGAGPWPLIPEVTAPSSHRRRGILVHRSRTLTAKDIRHRAGLRVTSPTRTVLDMQSRLDDARLIRLVNDLRAAGHLGPSAFDDLCRRSARISTLLGDTGLTRSELEDLFVRLVRAHRLPMPLLNARLPEHRREVDALYPDARLIIELDSWAYHRDHATFERDREKDADAKDLGYDTLRLTDRRMQRRGRSEMARIRRRLVAAGVPGTAAAGTGMALD